MNAAPLGLRVVGGASNRRTVVDFGKALALYAGADPSVQPELPAYLSAFAFPRAFRDHVKSNQGSVAGYDGPLGVPYLNFDIDRDNLDAALKDARRLASFLADRYAAEPLIHFSGGKGFHVQVPTAGAIELSSDNHAVAKHLALRIAGEVGVALDEGVYDRVRLWRAPNSRHHKTGLHKVRIAADDLLYLTADQIRAAAAEPVPYDLPVSPSAASRLVGDWCQSASAVRTHQSRIRSDAPSGGPARSGRINALTLALLTDPTSIQEGDRHRMILSAAANLAEFPTTEALVTALLTPVSLDTGLPPREVERQIRCGIEMARQQRHREGDAE